MYGGFTKPYVDKIDITETGPRENNIFLRMRFIVHTLQFYGKGVPAYSLKGVFTNLSKLHSRFWEYGNTYYICLQCKWSAILHETYIFSTRLFSQIDCKVYKNS